MLVVFRFLECSMEPDLAMGLNLKPLCLTLSAIAFVFSPSPTRGAYFLKPEIPNHLTPKLHEPQAIGAEG